MLDIKFLRENPDAVKENIKKKFQDEKLPLVDEVIKLDLEYRESKTKGDALRGDRNRISKEIGMFMGKGLKDEAESAKSKVKEINEELVALEVKEQELAAEAEHLPGRTEVDAQ